MVILRTAERQWIAEMPLTDGEAKAAKRYTDAVFGKVNASRGLRESDPFDLYDWHLKVFAGMSAEQIEKALDGDAHLRQFKGLSLDQARIRIAREYTKVMWAKLSKKKEEPPLSPEEG